MPLANEASEAIFTHVWHADLAADYPGWPAAEASLGAPERTRQARLRTPALRRTYGRAHGFLRAVLSQYVGQPAGELRFATELRDKPVLRPAALHFNLSYRAGRALLAVSTAGAVGADLEPLLPLADVEALVAQLFSEPEQAALRATPPAAWWSLFYLIWTRKEAYAKALGMGMALPFRAFSVLEIQAGGPPRLLAPAGAQLSSFEPAPGYQGSVAVLSSSPHGSIQHLVYPSGGPSQASR